MKSSLAEQISDMLRKVDPKFLPLLLGGAVTVFLLVDIFFVMMPQIHGVEAAGQKVIDMRRDKETLSANKKDMLRLTTQRDGLQQKIND
ncbi:MAG: hypothetical protein HQL18_02120, partial [Candidatus Omnitrophica bacterium]|nr:hypothetical protein [Candidatus Omnitrophota bacterium]